MNQTTIQNERGKTYTSKSIRMFHQDDVMSEAHAPSTWQGKVITFLLLAITVTALMNWDAIMTGLAALK